MISYKITFTDIRIKQDYFQRIERSTSTEKIEEKTIVYQILD